MQALGAPIGAVTTDCRVGTLADLSRSLIRSDEEASLPELMPHS
jgi:hypothetical protein